MKKYINIYTYIYIYNTIDGAACFSGWSAAGFASGGWNHFSTTRAAADADADAISALLCGIDSNS